MPTHPDALEASRPRYRAAGGKSDPGDAYILADLLRTGGHRFRALRASARGRDDLVAQLVALGIERHVAALPLGLVMSFPRAGEVPDAQVLAELAAEAGVAAVTHASGKSRAVTFRFACNKRLRAALTTVADDSRHASARAAHLYARARARGCDHPHAIRILARAWLLVLWRAWCDGNRYDPARHHAARLIASAA